MGKSILIVGGTGVISYAVVNEALKQGFKITCINRGKSKNQILPSSVEIIVADYRNETLVREKLKDRFYDSVIDVLCYTVSDIVYSVNLFKDKCNQYIFFSSCAVYNKGNGDFECSEDTKLGNPIWQYSLDKVSCEQKLVEIANKEHLNYTIVRPAVTYGNTRIPYGYTPPYGYHGTIIQRILNHKPIILWDSGEAISTITRVEDFAIGLVGILGNKQAYNTAVHIVGDERHKWKDVIDTLGKILNVTPIYFDLSKEEYGSEIPAKKGEIIGGRGISQLLNNTKIKNLVPGFGTTIPLEDGLRMTVNYYKTHNYLSGIDWAYDADSDRIIKKWAKKKGRLCKTFKIGFIDYLGRATYSDRIEYWLTYNKDCIIFYFLLKLKRFIERKIKK